MDNSGVLHNTEAEQALLGAILLDNDLMENIPDYFSEEHFASELNGRIYRAMKSMREIGAVADAITISAFLCSDPMFQKANGKDMLSIWLIPL